MKKLWIYAALMMFAWVILPAIPQNGGGLDDLAVEDIVDVDINRKLAESKELMLKAEKHFKKVSVAKACDDFIHNVAWRKGELFVFVFTTEAVCLAHGDDHDMIWKDIKDVKGIGGGPLIKDMEDVGKKGGRISYLWDNGFKSSYIKAVKKQGRTYYLGCGFYPESDEYTTKQLVKTAIAYFLKQGKITFDLISNPTGPFVKGDIYLGAYDYQGTTLAHGNNPALVGQIRIDEVDARGKPLVKELIRVARDERKGWLDYYWRKEFKRAYVERVVDPKTKIPYLITAGYYPHIDLKAVKNYVARAIHFLKAHGSKAAFSEFSSLVGQFAQGGLGIVVFDPDGKCLANGENPAFVGQNLLKLRGNRGRLYVKEIIQTVTKYGKGLVSYQSFNAHAVAYFERVDTPDGKFIIGAQFYPASKPTTTRTLVSRAVEHLTEHKPEQSFAAFSSKDSFFIEGDLRVFAYDADGIRLVNGTQKSQIWRNFLKTTDQIGKAVVDDIITIAINGGGWTEYKTSNATRKVYVKAGPKTLENGRGKNYIVGSVYFL